MRKIDLDKPTGRLTLMTYGPMKSGKTSMIASWPKLLVLAAGSEDGWETLKHMNRDLWHDPKVKPEVWAIDKPADFTQGIREAKEMLAKQPDRWRTIAVDTFSIVADDYLSFLETTALANRGGKKADGRELYGQLQGFLKARITELHALPVHVIWSCHEREPQPEFGKPGGPLIPGRASAEGFPARCSIVLYQTVEQVGEEIEYVGYSQHASKAVAGSRFADLIPNRIVNPDYSQIASAVGLVEGPIQMERASVIAPKVNRTPPKTNGQVKPQAQPQVQQQQPRK